MNYLKEYLESLLEDKPIGDKNKELWLDYLKEKYSKNYEGLFVSFVSEDKIGINPKSHFNTPNGIYTYPMKFLLDDNKVPFRGSNKPKKIKILKAVSGNVLDHNLSEEEYKSSLKKLNSKILDTISKYPDNKKEFFKTPEKFIEITEKSASANSLFGKLWNITRVLSKNPNDWSKILIDLGFDWVNDKGNGIIHNNEPTQAVFLNPNSYKVIDEEFVDTEERYNATNKDTISYEKLKKLFEKDDEIYDIFISYSDIIVEMIKKEFTKNRESKTLNLILSKLPKLSNILMNDVIHKLHIVIENGLDLDNTVIDKIPNHYIAIFLRKFWIAINGIVYKDLKNEFSENSLISKIIPKLENVEIYNTFKKIIKNLFEENKVKWLNYPYINEELQAIIIEDNKHFFIDLMANQPKIFVNSVSKDNAKYFFKKWKNALSDEEEQILQDLL